MTSKDYARKPVVSIFTLALAMLLGCSFSSNEKTGTITGQILLADGPLSEGEVGLYSNQTGFSIAGEVDKEGQYKISRVPVGDYAVIVTPLASLPPGDPNYVSKPPTKIPQKYHSAATSGLTLSVTGGENPLDLTLE